MGHFGFSLAACLCALFMVQAIDPFDSTLRCQEPPGWQVNGKDPLYEGRGKVTLLALLKAS